MQPSELLERLREPTAVSDLARLLVEELLDAQVGALLPASTLAGAVHQGLTAWLAAPTAEAALERYLEHTRAWLDEDRARLEALVPPELRQGLDELCAHPYMPGRQLLRAFIDQPPIRELSRRVMLELLLDFGRKVRAPVAGVARGLGGLAKAAAEQAKAVTGTLGALAGGMVGAVSSEVERQLEKRAADFVDAAMDDVLDKVADELTNPAKRAQQEALRRALLDAALDLTTTQLSAELERLDLAAAARTTRTALSKWLASAQAASQLEEAAKALWAPVADRPLREVLEELGLVEPARNVLHELLEARLSSTFQSQAFAAWLDGVVRSPSP